MSPPDDRANFERFLFDMIEGRHDGAASLLHEDVVWHLPPFAGAPPMQGRAAVTKFMRDAPDAYYQPGSMRIEPILWTLEGGRAACLATLRATTKKGKPYRNLYAFFARLEGGLLCEVWELMDTVHFQAQLRA
jgi:ketosteroid isomerase-like protein